MKVRERREPSYQVVVEGELRPPVLAFCAGPLAHHQTTGAFRLRISDDQGIADLVAMLEAAGLMILSVRQLTSPNVVVSADVSA